MKYVSKNNCNCVVYFFLCTHVEQHLLTYNYLLGVIYLLPLNRIPISGSPIKTEQTIAFDNKFFLSETLVKLIRDDYELKTP